MPQKFPNFAAKYKGYSNLKKFKHIVNAFVWTFIVVYALLIILLHLPSIQGFIGSEVADALSRKFGTHVSVGHVDLGFLNRIIVDDMVMLDQQNDSMLQTSRVSAKFDFIALAQGRIVISSAQLFGLNANLYKQNSDAKPNFQFVIDSLASKDTTTHTPLDLKIKSLIIRHGNVKYNQRDAAVTTKKFNIKHLNIHNLSAHLMLNHLTDNSIDLNVKRLSLDEESGLDIQLLQFRLIADNKCAKLQNFFLQLPRTELTLGDISATYNKKDGKIIMPSLAYNGDINDSKITLADFAFLLPKFKTFTDPIHIASSFSGTNSSVRIKSLNLNSENKSIYLKASGTLSEWKNNPHWFVHINNLGMSANGIRLITKNFGTNLKASPEINSLGNINFKGELRGRQGYFSTHGILHSDAGNIKETLEIEKNHFSGNIETDGVNVKRILNNSKFGIVATHIQVKGSLNPHSSLPAHLETLIADGNISRFDYNGHSFRNILVNGDLNKGLIKGKANIDDPLVSFEVDGAYELNTHRYNIEGQLNHLSPSKIIGLQTQNPNYMLTDVNITARNQQKESYLEVTAPFAKVCVNGKYDYTTLLQSITNLITSKIQTIPGLHNARKKTNNNFAIHATITNDEWLRQMFKLPITLGDSVSINGNMNDAQHKLNMDVKMPNFSYNGKNFKNGNIKISTPNDTLFAYVNVNQVDDGRRIQHLSIKAAAADNKLSTLLDYKNGSEKLPIRGKFNTNTEFFVNESGENAACINILPSTIQVSDSLWHVQSSNIVYSKNKLSFDHFAIEHGEQHIFINGLATKSKQDSLLVDLQDINVSYILNLVNFHSVDFTGKASGRASISSAFNNPDATAQLNVKDFTFEDGEMGTLYANVSYNKENKAIDIDAHADDDPEAQTFIKGYVSPAANDILLNITAKGTKMKFLESFTGSIMNNVNGHIYGNVSVIGPISSINLTGDVHATGSLHMKQLNTDYNFQNIHVVATPNEISLLNDTLYDRNGNIGIVNGGLHHINLTHLSYDVNVEARNLLCFDTHDFEGNNFYGTIYGTGKCAIHGKSGENILDIDATPEKGSLIVYNAASPNAISDRSFIHWHDATHDHDAVLKKDSISNSNEAIAQNQEPIDIPSDLRINFLVDANPNLVLKVLMDNQTGDYLALSGNGSIRASYFNKGSFDMFGNYVIDHGIYKLTVQNLIKKDFDFMPGGTIAFGGNAYDATLNLTAKHTVNGVSLADLNIGKSFSSNNIRVDCLMNITGTPNQPKIDFSLDMPTVNNDAKQMVTSIINSEEEMNQQVLYLLAVGRFYEQGNNNAAAENAQQQSQTSLAMQSLLSGTISQQINNVLSSVVNNNNWNFGANISTGDEGWNNAEYEGLLSGRTFNNRLLFNGQFGYRDNANATTSFIGDFDLRYLLYPNGNLAVRVYNQTNDRYFTRNSLTTQGLGIIMKKDFNGWRDFLGITRKKKKNKETDNKKK